MTFRIRTAWDEDAKAISHVIIAALRTTNAQDYSPEVIARVEKSFSPTAVSILIRQRQVFVAIENDGVVGTASLDGQVVRSFFVLPASQRKGIGRKLMEAIEQAASDSGVEVLSVPSSVTAEAFYIQLGFVSMPSPIPAWSTLTIGNRASRGPPAPSSWRYLCSVVANICAQIARCRMISTLRPQCPYSWMSNPDQNWKGYLRFFQKAAKS